MLEDTLDTLLEQVFVMACDVSYIKIYKDKDNMYKFKISKNINQHGRVHASLECYLCWKGSTVPYSTRVAQRWNPWITSPDTIIIFFHIINLCCSSIVGLKLVGVKYISPGKADGALKLKHYISSIDKEILEQLVQH